MKEERGQFAILQDSREQAPLSFPNDPLLKQVIVETLPIGDYMMAFADGTRPPVAFERKSLTDLAGTLTREIERFKAEMARAQDANLSLIVLVESSLRNIWNGAPYVQESGKSLVQRCFTLMVRYRLPIVFCQDRREAARYLLEYAKAISREYAVSNLREK